MEKHIISRRHQVVTVTKTATGVTVDQVELDKTFDECIGIQVTEVDSSSVKDYNIGLFSGGRKVVDPMNAKAIQSDTSVSMRERKLPLCISTSDIAEIQSEVNESPTGTLKFQVIFELVKYTSC